MSEKVTSFELSKRLHELGFDCESHTGWWLEDSIYYEGTFYQELRPTSEQTEDYKFIPYKAYDCWDLLMWLQCNNKKIPGHYQLWIHESVFEVVEEGCGYREQVGKESASPVNCLALAVVKILEENDLDD